VSETGVSGTVVSGVGGGRAAGHRLEQGRATPDWLALREPADAAARSLALLDALVPRLASIRSGAPADRPLVVHDLGSGLGSMRRWLAPRLPAPQRWVEHDRDLGHGAACGCDLAGLTVDHLTPADLVTGSALLDVVTAEVVDRVVAAAAGLRTPLLLTLSVDGRVRIDPAEPLDGRVAAAFNDHQRRRTSAGRLLGADAVPYATARLTASGAVVRSEPSPWRLRWSSGRLAATWFDGWLGAAGEQDPGLVALAASYRTRRLA
jgi:hypothetical protein